MALIGNGRRRTYKELADWTNRLAHALIEGQDDPHGKQWATLGTTTLYDLTDERLGHNSTLQISA